MKPKFCAISLFSLFFFCMPMMAQDILYVGDELNPADSALIEYLEYVGGFSITIVPGTEYATTPYAAAATYNKYDAVYISETLGSSQVVNFKEAGFPIPCVTNEGYAVRTDRWGFLMDDDAEFIQPKGDARTPGTLTLVIQDVDHWIANLYPADYNLRWTHWEDSLSDQIGVTGFKLYENITGAVEIGQFKSDTVAGFPGMWAITEGSKTPDGTELPNMVIIGTVAKALGKNATEEYHKLVYYSMLWVTDNTDEVVSIFDIPGKNLNIWPNPTNGIVNLTLTTPVSQNAKINIYNISGKLIKSINSGHLAAGKNTLNIDFSDQASGLYIFEVRTENDFIRGKMYKN